MRPMEQQAIKRLAEQGKLDKEFVDRNETNGAFIITYVKRAGGFTICLVKNLDCTWLGVSRRSYKDKPNRTKGEMLALIRAITSPPVW